MKGCGAAFMSFGSFRGGFMVGVWCGWRVKSLSSWSRLPISMVFDCKWGFEGCEKPNSLILELFKGVLCI